MELVAGETIFCLHIKVCKNDGKKFIYMQFLHNIEEEI